MVLLVHAAFATRPWVQTHLPEWLQALLQRMDVGVAVFFVLSGFLLFRPFVARQLAGQAAGEDRARSCGGGRCGCSPGTGSRSPSASSCSGQVLGSVKNAFLYYSLLFPFASQNVALGGGPGTRANYAIPQAWSLTAEFVFYLMLPVIAVPARAAGGAKVGHACRCARAADLPGGLYLFGQLFRAVLPRRPALVGAGGRHLGAQLGRLLRHRDGHGGLQRRRAVAGMRLPSLAAVPRRPSGGVVDHRRARRPELRHVLAADDARRVRRRVLGALVPLRCVLVLPARAGDVRRPDRRAAAGASSPASRSCCSARCRSASTCSTSR